LKKKTTKKTKRDLGSVVSSSVSITSL